VTERRQSSVDFRVRYSETDRMGFAYHGHYVAWCEMARTEHMRRLGVRYRDLEDRGVFLAVVSAQFRFAKPAYYDDTLRAWAWVTDVGSRLVTFGYRIERLDDDAVLATAETSLVSIDGAGRPSRLPADVRARLQELMRER
jgi:acyl-CoA thioester hydrolase